MARCRMCSPGVSAAAVRPDDAGVHVGSGQRLVPGHRAEHEPRAGRACHVLVAGQGEQAGQDGVGQRGVQGADVLGGHAGVVQFHQGRREQPAGLAELGDVGRRVDGGADQQRVTHLDRGQVHGPQDAGRRGVLVLDDEVMHAGLDHLHVGSAQRGRAGYGVDR